MPGPEHDDFDERIAAALRETAREPEADGVLHDVQRKRHQRQVRRRTGAVALSVAALLAVGGLTTALLRDGDDDDGGGNVDIATPDSTPSTPSTETTPSTLPPFAPTVEVHDGEVPLDASAPAGQPVEPAPLEIAEDPYVRPPIVTRGEGNRWIATYERDGDTYSYPPSHLVEFTTGARVDLQGKIQSFTTGDPYAWAVTRDKEISQDNIEYRLKRIDAALKARSYEIPSGDEPAGPVVASAEAAWVPVRDGLLRYDAQNPLEVDKIVLSEQEHRSIVIIDGEVFATDGAAIVRVAGSDAVPTGVASSSPLRDLVMSGTSVWALTEAELVQLSGDLSTIVATTPLPLGMTDPALGPWNLGVMVSGRATIDGAPQLVALLVADDTSIAKTVVVPDEGDSVIATEADDHLLIATGGTLYDIPL